MYYNLLKIINSTYINICESNFCTVQNIVGNRKQTIILIFMLVTLLTLIDISKKPRTCCPIFFKFINFFHISHFFGPVGGLKIAINFTSIRLAWVVQPLQFNLLPST
jgi:hypothetical protein